MGSVRPPRQGRQRALAIVLGFAGLAVVAVLGWKSWRLCIEHWYIAKLDSDDREARERAVTRLGEMASVRAVPYLIEAIAGHHGDGSEPFDESAWRKSSLVHFSPDGRVVFSWGGRVIEPGQSWSGKCSKAIEAAGIEGLPGLEGKLRSRDLLERLWAVHQIGRVGPDAAAVSRSLFAVLSDEDPRVRGQAARAMASIGWRSSAVLDSLGEALRSRTNPPELRESCLAALAAAARMPHEPILVGHSSNGGMRIHLPDPLELEADRTLSAVLGILADSLEGEGDGLRQAIARDFLELLQLRDGPPGWDARFDPKPAVLRLVADRDAAVRAGAVRFLARGAATFDEPTLSALARALDDPVADVRGVAAAELKAMGTAAIPVWLEALEPGYSLPPETAVDALATMGAGARECWPFLLERLPRAQGESASSLARALGTIGAASGIGVPELALALDSPGAAARRCAAEALGHYGAAASGAGPALLEALGDEDPAVRAAAAFSIVSTRGVPLESLSAKAVPILAACLSDEDPSVWWRAAEALGALGPAARTAVPALTRALRDRQGLVNPWALSALGAIGPDAASAVPAVLSIIEEGDDKNIPEALGAIKAIGREPDLAIPAIRRLLVEPHDLHGAFATGALAAFGERAVPALVEALSSRDHRVRGGAIGSLAKIGPAGRAALPALARVEAEDPLASLRVQAGLAMERIRSDPRRWDGKGP